MNSSINCAKGTLDRIDRLKIVSILIFCFLSIGTNAQSLIGAWEGNHAGEHGESFKSVVIFTEKHQVLSLYDAKTGKFISTNGGFWELNGETITETVEFDSADPERVGSQVSFKITLNDSIMGIVGSDMKWKRLDTGAPGKLNGAWLMSGRKRDGEIQARDTSGPRKTMKILSGTRFQWIAYNTETKQFSGTGGGTYTTIDGEYTENIEFFSKDDSRVGASLSFKYELIDGNWHHSGNSSKGDPIYEIWSLRE